MPATTQRRLPFTGAVNFRDLGGHETSDGRRVAAGRLFRSDSLSELTAPDLEAIARLGLRTVCDLRQEHERVARPNRLPLAEAPRTRLIGFSPKGTSDMWAAINAGTLSAADVVEEMRRHYRRFVDDHGREYGELLQLLLEPGAVPILIHCASGKDRTGFAIAIVLLALGVPRAAIIEDYVISDLHRRDLAHLVGPGAHPEAVNAVAQAVPEYLHAAFHAIDTRWGGETRYLEDELGFSALQRESLRELLLEPIG